MSINWEAMRAIVSEEANQTRLKTSKDLSEEIARVSKLTGDEIFEMFTTEDDLSRLNTLVEVLLSAESENQKQTYLIDNIIDLKGVVLKLMLKLV